MGTHFPPFYPFYPFFHHFTHFSPFYPFIHHFTHLFTILHILLHSHHCHPLTRFHHVTRFVIINPLFNHSHHFTNSTSTLTIYPFHPLATNSQTCSGTYPFGKLFRSAIESVGWQCILSWHAPGAGGLWVFLGHHWGAGQLNIMLSCWRLNLNWIGSIWI